MTLTADELQAAVGGRLARLADDAVVPRIWARDPAVWGGTRETPELADRLGWLTVADWTAGRLAELTTLAGEVAAAFDRVLLLGMGGASLAAEVLARCFGRQDGYPAFELLDSTHPIAVQTATERAPLDRTLFVVSSKSGTTIETESFLRYFWDAAGGRGRQFVAITDAGTPLERLGIERGFRAVFTNPADIGGRYAALSYFGLLPAAVMGLDVERILEAGRRMAAACRAGGDVTANPGAHLGALLGAAALAGRDKLTLCMDPAVRSVGLWLEQLIAESTGKDGKGIVPLPDEDLRDPLGFADDRLFVILGLKGSRESGTVRAVRDVEQQGHPVHRIELAARYELGAEFFRWAFATAVAGHLLGVNPFDQPNVAEAKRNSEAVLAGGRERGSAGAGSREVAQLLGRVAPGDYVALLAYVPPSSRMDQRLDGLQTALRRRVGSAVTVGYGPRYLHSTGQLHKGGPPTGHFIQVYDAPGLDREIPGAGYSFGRLLAAQAAGDYQALAARGRPVIRVPRLEVLEEVVR